LLDVRPYTSPLSTAVDGSSHGLSLPVRRGRAIGAPDRISGHPVRRAVPPRCPCCRHAGRCSRRCH
jgi:hypothetical protein